MEWVLRVIAVLAWFALTMALLFLVGFALIYGVAWLLYKAVEMIGVVW